MASVCRSQVGWGLCSSCMIVSRLEISLSLDSVVFSSRHWGYLWDVLLHWKLQQKMRAAKHRTNMQGYSWCRFSSCCVCVCVWGGGGGACVCVLLWASKVLCGSVYAPYVYIHFRSSIHLVSYSRCLKLPLKQLMWGLFHVAAPAADENHARSLYQCSAAPDLWPFNSCWSQGSGQGHLQQFHVHGQICGGLKTGSGLNIAAKASCSNSVWTKLCLHYDGQRAAAKVICSNLAVDKTVLVWTLSVNCSQSRLWQLGCGQNCACVNTVSGLQPKLPVGTWL